MIRRKWAVAELRNGEICYISRSTIKARELEVTRPVAYYVLQRMSF